MRRRAGVLTAALAGLVALWVIVLWPPPSSHPSAPTPVAAALPTAEPSARHAPAVAAAPKATLVPRTVTRSAAPRPSIAPTAAARPTATRAPAPVATRPPAYSFAPKAQATGATPGTDLRLSDLTLSAGQSLTWDVTMGSPGALLFDAHTASSSATAGSYPLKDLLACVEYVGQHPCTPVATPQPAYWAVTSVDLVHHTHYRVRVLATANSSLLAGIRVGWRGPNRVNFAGAQLPGGCQASVGKGYVAGCGFKYKITTNAATPFTVTTATSGLQISMKNTVTNAKVYSGPLTSPQTIQVPSAGEWSGHLYPSDGHRVPTATLTFDWK